MKKGNDIKVFISNRDSICDECREELGRRAWITMEADNGAFCLTCELRDVHKNIQNIMHGQELFKFLSTYH